MWSVTIATGRIKIQPTLVSGRRIGSTGVAGRVTTSYESLRVPDGSRNNAGMVSEGEAALFVCGRRETERRSAVVAMLSSLHGWLM